MADNKKEEYHFFAEEKRYDPNRFTLGPKVSGEEKSENFKSHNFVYLFVAIGFIFLFVFGFVFLSDYSKTTHQTSGVFYVISGVSNFGNGLFSSLTGKVVDESSQTSQDSSESTTSSSPEQTIESSSGAPEESPIEPAPDSAQESPADIASEEQIIEPPLPPIPELPTEETPSEEIPSEQPNNIIEENQTTESSNEETNETTSEENITVIDLEPVSENQTVETNESAVLEQNIISNISTQVSTKQYGAVIGKPVKWEKKIVVETNQESTQTINVDLPSIAGNVSVSKIDGETGNENDITQNSVVENEKQIEEQDATVSITGNVIVADSNEGIITVFFNSLALFFKSILSLTGHAINESLAGDNVSVAVSETVSNNDQIVVEYYTEAPYAEEKLVEDGKEVTIVGPDAVHYQDVLAYSDLPSETKDLSKIKLYWLTSDSGDTQEVNFTAVDNDGNGLYDAVEWVVPHLSNQSYRLIVITNALHLDASKNYVSDIYDSVSAQDGKWSETIENGEYVRVRFERNLTLGNDLTIYARGNGVIKVLNENQDNSIGEFNISGEREYKIYPNYSNSDVYDLLVLGSVEFDYIVDPVPACGGFYTMAQILAGGFECASGNVIYSDFSSSGLGPTNIVQFIDSGSSSSLALSGSLTSGSYSLSYRVRTTSPSTIPAASTSATTPNGASYTKSLSASGMDPSPTTSSGTFTPATTDTSVVSSLSVSSGTVTTFVDTYALEDLPLGTAGNPYPIYNWTDLNNTRNNLTAYYILMNDLSSSDGDYVGIGDSWIPIGTCGPSNECDYSDYTYTFQGNFNGNGKTISDLTIPRGTTDLPENKYLGLFGYVSGGNISNINLVNVNITGYMYVGGLVGFQWSSSITNSSSISTLTGGTPSYRFGGLVGFQWSSSITNSSSTSTLTGGANSVSFGGLVGYQDSSCTITNSSSTSTLTGGANSQAFGGLVGFDSSSIITDSSSTSTLTGGTGSKYFGGLVGEFGYDICWGDCGSIVSSSFSISDSSVLNSSTYVGLIVGKAWGDGTITSTYGTIYDSQYGNITFLDWNVTNVAGGNLLDSIYINNNSAYTNGSIAGYNRSANITLNLAGWGITNPQINKNGATCSAPDCNVLSYNTTTKIIVFNVTSWSNYSVSETPNPFALTACGTLNTTGANYILQNSVNISSGNCFTLTANNIILDLNGYNISGNNNGFEFGILAYGLSNITIKNGLIDKWGDLGRAIYLWDTNESLISNMTITNSYTGLSVRTSSYNIFRDIYFYSDIVAFSHSGSNNILSNIFINESNDDGPSIGYGLYLSSTNDTIINNLTVKYSTNAIYLDHTTSSNNNTITNFTSLSNSYDIFSYGFTPNKNNSLIYNSLFGQIKVYPIAAVISGGLSFPGSLLLANNSIFVNNSISGLSTNTLGSLYNLPTNFNNPKIFKNSLYCLNCLNTTSLNNGNPSFTLEGSGNYSIIDVNSNNITSIVSVNNNNPIRTENLTITASINAATSVWMTIWANNISGTVLLSNNLTNTTANSWNISLATNLSYRVGTYNYTLYANNSLGFFVSQNYTFNSLEQTNISYCRTLDQDNTIYTLIADINSTVNNCLYITRSNVTLNGNGHVLNNINYTASTIIGIYGNGVYNVTIMNFKNITHFAGTTLVGGAGINLINTGTTYSIKNNSFYNCTYGMALTGSNSNIKNNVIVNPNNVTTIYGIYILGSDNVIEDNVIYQPVGQTNGIYLFSGLRSKYVNNNITAFKSFTPAAIGQKVDQIIYNNTYGQVVWYNNTATITNNVTLDNIIISQNNINLNLSLMPLMNKTAEIVFYNHDYHGQYPLRLLNMGKGGVPCNSTFGCNNFTSLTASTVRFNVTDFGNGEIMVGKVLRSQSNVSLSTGWNMISLQMNGSSAGDKVVPLSHGWNLVGVSNDAGVEYANINYTNSSGDSLSMLAASRRGHVQKQFAYLEADGNGIKRYNYAPLETSALTNGKGYWVYVNDADGGNLTLPGAGGNDLGESYSLSDLTFVNASGVEANISEAVSEGWVDPYPSYWNPNHVMLDPITEEEIIRPAWERVGVDRLDQKIYSWEGLFFYSNRNNITLLRQD